MKYWFDKIILEVILSQFIREILNQSFLSRSTDVNLQLAFIMIKYKKDLM